MQFLGAQTFEARSYGSERARIRRPADGTTSMTLCCFMRSRTITLGTKFCSNTATNTLLVIKTWIRKVIDGRMTISLGRVFEVVILAQRGADLIPLRRDHTGRSVTRRLKGSSVRKKLHR